jgi:SAM-dependent methyltransferase
MQFDAKPMDPYGKEELIRFYDQQLSRFGDSPSALHWKPDGQRLRYGLLCDIAGDLSGLSVLDFGCGKGDLYHFLSERTDDLRYCGIDVNEGLVELARKKFPGGEFLCVDIEETCLDRAFDVVLICGVFNLRIAGITESMRSCLRRLFPLCRKALHLNAPSADAPWKDIAIHYVDPDGLLRFARKELAPSSVLNNSPVPDDLFLSVYRD